MVTFEPNILPDMPIDRSHQIQQLTQSEAPFDMAIIGGGATGLGVALDAVSRGYKVALFEQADFAKGTSSRSTKLVHGGVRYLAQGNVKLVLEALRERGILAKNAGHLVKKQPFVIPVYTWFDRLQYTIGLKLYDALSGSLSIGPSHFISKEQTLAYLPTIKEEGLKGGVVYYDGQFDDARLTINLVQTIIEKGAVALNYSSVKGLLKNEAGKVEGVEVEDKETGIPYTVAAKVVVNATGVFVDDVLQMDKPGQRKVVKPSQGVHVVLDRTFLPQDYALMIPKTSDGRVLFAVPWHDKLVVGTTDVPKEEADLEPRATDEEIDFILETAGQYMVKAPTRADVKAVFAGLRPLAAPMEEGKSSKEISRGHRVWVSDSGLVTITGGKWTTFRKMGEDVVDKLIPVGGLKHTPSTSEALAIRGNLSSPDLSNPFYVYGTDEPELRSLMKQDADGLDLLHPNYPYTHAQVRWAAREEMARTVEDVLSRRLRMLLLDAGAAVEMAPAVARILAEELGREESWIQQQLREFEALASSYQLTNSPRLPQTA